MRALAACQAKEEALPREPEVPEGYKTLQINASYQETKSAYDGDVIFSWTEGDEISVICNDGAENSWASLMAVTWGSRETTFSAVVQGDVATGSLTGTRMALFPASNRHRYTDDSTIDFYIPAERDFRDSENTAIPMFAYGNDTDAFAFANMCGAIKFVLNNSGSAPVINKRPMKLVLLRGDVRTVLVENLGEVRDVPPGGSRTFSRTFTIPASGIQSGDKLALWLPDAYSSIADLAVYAIRLANNEDTKFQWVTFPSLTAPTDPVQALGGYNVFYTFPYP